MQNPLPANMTLTRRLAWVYVLFDRAAVPLLALAVLLLLLLLVDQSRDVLRDVFDRLVLGTRDWGASYARAAHLAYAAIWVSSFLLASIVGLSALALATPAGGSADPDAARRSRLTSIFLFVVTICAVHATFVQSVGHDRLFILQIGVLAGSSLLVALRQSATGLRPVFLVTMGQCAAMLLLGWIAVAEVRGQVVGTAYSWGLLPAPASEAAVAAALPASVPVLPTRTELPYWNVLTGPFLSSVLTPQLALLLAWLARNWRLPMLRDGGVHVMLALYTFALTVLVFAPWRPETMLWIGPLAVAFIWLAWMTGVLSCFALVRRRAGLPTLLLLAAFVAFFIGWRNESIGRERLPAVSAAPSDSGRLWQVSPAGAHREARDLVASYPGLAHPLLISADGGGLRAAIFTAMVLTLADDFSCGEFGRHVRAASGVSGGSLGLATWVVMRQEYVRREGPRAWLPCWQTIAEGQRTKRNHVLTSTPVTELVMFTLLQDHLSMPLFGTLVHDALLPSLPAQRGRYLVESWQGAALAVLGSQNPAGYNLPAFAAPLPPVTDGSSAPLLAFNATDADTGNLVVQSNLRELSDVDTTNLSIGVAALNSARFPLISPAGLLLQPSGKWMRVVDGGFFDNTGAIALGELIEHAGPRIPSDARYIRINGSTTSDNRRCDRFWEEPAPSVRLTEPEVAKHETPAAAQRWWQSLSSAFSPTPPRASSAPPFDGWSAGNAALQAREAHGRRAVERLAGTGAPARVKPARASPIDIDLMDYFQERPSQDGARADESPSDARFARYENNVRVCAAQAESRRLPLGWYLSVNSGFLLRRQAQYAATRLLCDIPREGPVFSSPNCKFQDTDVDEPAERLN